MPKQQKKIGYCCNMLQRSAEWGSKIITRSRDEPKKLTMAVSSKRRNTQLKRREELHCIHCIRNKSFILTILLYKNVMSDEELKPGKSSKTNQRKNQQSASRSQPLQQLPSHAVFRFLFAAMYRSKVSYTNTGIWGSRFLRNLVASTAGFLHGTRMVRD